MSTRVLITGGCGFIGYHLASRLAQEGHQVDLVDNLSRGVRDADLAALLETANVRVLELDLRASEALKSLATDYDYIFHLAAILGVEQVLKRPYEVLTTNVAMQGNVIELARRCRDLRRFVFASTSEVYAGTLQYHGLTLPTPESTRLTLPELSHGRTSYMLSKIYGEALCHHAGVPFSIIRPHNIYGPRMGLSHVIPELLKKAYDAPDEGRVEVFSPEHRRTFCYIADAVEQILGIARSEHGAGATLNVGTESPEVPMRELGEIVVGIVGRTMGRRLSVAESGTTAGSVARRCPDMTENQRVTGVASRVGLPEGVGLTFEWYLNRVFRPGGVCAR